MNNIIRHRRSVRTFNGVPLKPETAKEVLDYANSVENPYGLSIQWYQFYSFRYLQNHSAIYIYILLCFQSQELFFS